jgi:hypothetical protein
MSDFMLSIEERNVLVIAAQTKLNFREVARMMSLNDASSAKQLYEQARSKLEAQLHGIPDVTQLTAPQLVRKLGVGRRWIDARIDQHFSAHAIPRTKNGKPVNYYPAGVCQQLEQMAAQHLAHPPARDYLTLEAIAKKTNRHRETVKGFVSQLHVQPVKRRDAANRLSEYYPPEVISLITETFGYYPPSGDWLTVNAIKISLGADWEWVRKQIEELKVVGEIRKVSAKYGKLAMHYPPETLDRLRDIYQSYPEAGDYITANTIQDETGRSDNWVRRRLASCEFEIRKDAQGVPRKHYSPGVLSDLMARRDEDNRGRTPRKRKPRA